MNIQTLGKGERFNLPPRPMPTRVLIAGGYGSVGGRIAQLLAPEIGDRLIIGGRSQKKASQFAQSLNSGATARMIDAGNLRSYSDALDDVALMIVCFDIDSLELPKACIERSIDYIDITASIEVIERLKTLNNIAKDKGVSIVSSVGLAPGLSSLMAKACIRYATGPVSSLSIHILLGLGEHHGKAALEWMVDRLYRPYWLNSVSGDGRRLPFDRASKTVFPKPVGERITYQIDFSDQHTLPDTLNIPTASTWCTFDQQWMADLLSFSARSDVVQLMKYPTMLHWITRCFDMLPVGSDQFALVVEAHERQMGVHTRCSATGFGTAHATAVVAAATTHHMLDTRCPGGAFQLETLLDIAHILEALTENNIHVSAHPVTMGTSPHQPAQSLLSSEQASERVQP